LGKISSERCESKPHFLKAKTPQNFKKEEKTIKKSQKQERLNQREKRDVTKLEIEDKQEKHKRRLKEFLLNF